MDSRSALEQSTVLLRQVQGAGQEAELLAGGRSRRREMARATPTPLYTILALVEMVSSLIFCNHTQCGKTASKERGPGQVFWAVRIRMLIINLVIFRAGRHENHENALSTLA
jgi:hypothetical protein